MENAKPNDIEAVAVHVTDPKKEAESAEQALPAPVAATKPNGAPTTNQVNINSVSDQDNAAPPCEAMTSMILGIVAIVIAFLLSWIPVVGWFLGIVGVIMGITAIGVGSYGLCKINKTSNDNGKCHAITGIVTGSVAACCGLICVVMVIVLLGVFAAAGASVDLSVDDDWRYPSN